MGQKMAQQVKVRAHVQALVYIMWKLMVDITCLLQGLFTVLAFETVSLAEPGVH